MGTVWNLGTLGDPGWGGDSRRQGHWLPRPKKGTDRSLWCCGEGETEIPLLVCVRGCVNFLPWFRWPVSPPAPPIYMWSAQPLASMSFKNVTPLTCVFAQAATPLGAQSEALVMRWSADIHYLGCHRTPPGRPYLSLEGSLPPRWVGSQLCSVALSGSSKLALRVPWGQVCQRLWQAMGLGPRGHVLHKSPARTLYLRPGSRRSGNHTVTTQCLRMS